MGKKMTLKGVFTKKPEDGKFSWAHTRWAITEILLSIPKQKKENGEVVLGEDGKPVLSLKERLFAEAFGFDVTKEGEFTIELQVNVNFDTGSDKTMAGMRKEKAIKEIMTQVEDKFAIGGHVYTEDEQKAIDDLAMKGVYTIGYFMNLKDEDAK